LQMRVATPAITQYVNAPVASEAGIAGGAQ
jgi:hypothetical protein